MYTLFLPQAKSDPLFDLDINYTICVANGIRGGPTLQHGSLGLKAMCDEKGGREGTL